MSEAGSVGEALDELAAGPVPAWILLDLMLPDGCGTRVLERVRENGWPARVCVVTGCGGDRVDAALAAGAEYALTKPVDVQRLWCVLEG